ncbi:MAG TPA: twin-arginine translocation signal domain-containing protein [Actinomycetota bacterium]|nr:twin-arginine translocation signal domain-containing protein [Actinomycetota bacterium]
MRSLWDGATTRRGFLRTSAAGATALSVGGLARPRPVRAAVLDQLTAADDYVAIREAVTVRSYGAVQRGNAVAEFERWRLTAARATREFFDGVVHQIEEAADGLVPFRLRSLEERRDLLYGLLNARGAGEEAHRRRQLGVDARTYAAEPAVAGSPSPQIEYVLSALVSES